MVIASHAIVCSYREPDTPGLVIGGKDSSIDAPCNRIFTDPGRCVANHSLYGDSYLQAVADAGGFPLQSAEKMMLRCWVSNASVGDGRAVCINSLTQVSR